MQKAWKTKTAKRVMRVAQLDNIDKAIEKIVEGLMDGLACPPTNLEALARRMNIMDIRNDNTMIVPGELRKLHQELVVFLAPNLPTPRRRFTIAHELGHAFFENTGRRPHPSTELEILCDKFAAEFLMPQRIFKFHAGQCPDLNQVRELCRVFQTSLSATLNRVSDIYNYRTFELKDNKVVWRRRVSMQVLCQITDEIQMLSSQIGTKRIELYEMKRYSTWHLEWEVLEEKNHKIVLLHRI